MQKKNHRQRFNSQEREAEDTGKGELFTEKVSKKLTRGSLKKRDDFDLEC